MLISIAGSTAVLNIKLGDKDTLLRVAFGPEQSKYNTDNPQKRTMKVELNGDTEQFVRTFEAKVVEAGIANKDKLFKKGMFVPSDDAIKNMFMSKLTESTNPIYPAPSFKFTVRTGENATEVLFAPSMDELSKVEPGPLDEIKQGMFVFPIINPKGGLWVSPSGYGVTFEATNLLVVKQARGTKRKMTGLSAFDLEAVDTAASDVGSEASG